MKRRSDLLELHLSFSQSQSGCLNHGTVIKGYGSTYLTSGQLNLEQGSVLILVLLR